MSTPLKDRVRSAAIATPALTARLGTNPFRWYDRQLNQGSTLPAVVTQAISDSSIDTIVGRMPMAFTRYQFTIWAVNNATGMQQLADIEGALKDFIEMLDLVGIPGLCSYSNLIVNMRDGFFPLPSPGNPQRIIDARLYYNDEL